MERWTIEANVTPELAVELDPLVKDLEKLLTLVIEQPSYSPPPEPIEWVNGVLAGVSELSNIVVCPDEYDKPRAALKDAALRLAAILVIFQYKL